MRALAAVACPVSGRAAVGPAALYPHSASRTRPRRCRLRAGSASAGRARRLSVAVRPTRPKPRPGRLASGRGSLSSRVCALSRSVLALGPASLCSPRRLSRGFALPRCARPRCRSAAPPGRVARPFLSAGPLWGFGPGWLRPGAVGGLRPPFSGLWPQGFLLRRVHARAAGVSCGLRAAHGRLAGLKCPGKGGPISRALRSFAPARVSPCGWVSSCADHHRTVGSPWPRYPCGGSPLRPTVPPPPLGAPGSARLYKRAAAPTAVPAAAPPELVWLPSPGGFHCSSAARVPSGWRPCCRRCKFFSTGA